METFKSDQSEMLCYITQWEQQTKVIYQNKLLRLQFTFTHLEDTFLKDRQRTCTNARCFFFKWIAVHSRYIFYLNVGSTHDLCCC